MSQPMRFPIATLAREVWRYSAGRRRTVVLYLALSCMANLVDLVQPVLIGRAFDAAQFTANPLRRIVTNLLLSLACVGVLWMLHGVSRVLEQRNAFLVRRDYKLAMLRRVMELPPSWHTDNHSGSTITQVNRAGDSLKSFANDGFILVSSTVALVGSLLMLLRYDRLVAAAAAIATVVTFWILSRFDARLIPGYSAVNAAENALATAVHDAISNIATVFTLRLQTPVQRELRRRADAGYETYARNSRTNELKWCTADLTIASMVCLSLIAAAVRMERSTGLIAIGSLFVLYRYLHEVGQVFRTFADMYGSVIQWSTNVRDAAHIEADHARLVRPIAAELPHDWQELRVTGLRFSYATGDDARAHVDGVDLTIRRGQRIAFIGESGSGKSTTLALLRALYPATSGALHCDGQQLPHGLAHLADTTMLIPQTPDVFNATVLANITMDVEHDPADVARAIEMASFGDVVARLPQGLETNVMEKGVSLSGGENQRLALARGLLAADGSTLLLLDESTSSVDTVNEDRIYRRVFAAFPQATIIACVHGLDLLPRFDEICLFARGKIIARGSYQQLLDVPAFRRMLARGASHDASDDTPAPFHRPAQLARA